MRALTFGPAGERVLFIRGQQRVLDMSARDGTAQPDFNDRGRGVSAFAFHPRGEALALGRVDGSVQVLNYPGLEPCAEVPVFPKAEVSALAFDAAGDILAIGSRRGDIAIACWRLE